MYTLEDGGGVEAVHSFDTLKQPKQAKSRTQKAYNFWLGRAAKMYRPEKYEQKKIGATWVNIDLKSKLK